jgi:indole-3-glycerol phosphate synthase
VSDFDVSRIVPSTRELFAALMTQRKGLALLPELSPSPELLQEVERLAALDVRAFAVGDAADALLTVARATPSTPALCLVPCQSAEECQRARFHGADGVCIAADSAEEWSTLSKTAQSMRMMPLAYAVDLASTQRADAWGARAIVVAADAATIAAVAQALPTPKMLIALVAELDEAGLTALEGQVDAAVVPAAIHAAGRFDALLDTLDA